MSRDSTLSVTLLVLNDAAVVPVAHLEEVGRVGERVLGEGSVLKVLEDERPLRVALDHLHRLRLAVRLLHLFKNTAEVGCKATVCQQKFCPYNQAYL